MVIFYQIRFLRSIARGNTHVKFLKKQEKEFKMGADTPVMVGLTSEAVGPVVYENIVIEPVERTEEPVIEEPVVEETTGETLPGTVKGVYADAGAGICLQ